MSEEKQSAAPEPWAPEGADKIGVGPSRDNAGERGTSVYDGDGASDERGPSSGVEYHGHDITETAATHPGNEHVREPASKES